MYISRAAGIYILKALTPIFSIANTLKILFMEPVQNRQ